MDEANIKQALRGCQNICAPDGSVLFNGGWDSRELFKAVTLGDESFWSGKKVLDIGSNTSGLSVQIARRGASVLAIEPDPYRNTKALARDTLDAVVSSEGLDLKLGDHGLFDAHKLGTFDVVMCLGLVYHFRDQQFTLDYLSTVDAKELIVSNQTHPGDSLAMVNRMDSSIPFRSDFWDGHKEALSGWHPTRPMFERMIRHAGFDEVTALTDPSVNFPDKPLKGITNSAYYWARRVTTVDPVQSRFIYIPR